MDSYQREQNASVIHLPSDPWSPLEIWDGSVDDLSLLSHSPLETPHLFKKFFRDLYLGQASFTNFRPPSFDLRIKGFDHLFLAGGNSQGLERIMDSRELPFSLSFVENPQFAGVRGLKNLSSKKTHGLYLDWGQTHIKGSFEKRQFKIPRDYDLFPIDFDPKDLEKKRAKIREYFLNLISKSFSKVETVYLSLPIEIFDLENTGHCSVGGLGDNLVELFKIEQASVFIINDALAAASSVKVPQNVQKALFVTFGHAMGGALFQR